MTHSPVSRFVYVTELLVWAAHSESEMMVSSTSSKVIWLVAGQEAVEPHPGKEELRKWESRLPGYGIVGILCSP